MAKRTFSTIEVRKSAVRAVLRGQSVAQIAKTFSRDRSAIHRWVQLYKKNGRYSDLQIKPRNGRPQKVSLHFCQQLKKDVLKPASKFDFETDLWTCARIVSHAKKAYGVNVSRLTMARKMKKIKMSYQKPERRYYEADKQKQAAWISQELPLIKEAVLKNKAILYFQDESCIRLSPVVGKTWARVGITPVQRATGNRGSVAAMSAVSSSGHLVFKLETGRIKSKEVIGFLEQMLAHHPRRHLVVVMDRAGPHTSKMVKNHVLTRKRLHVFYLPPRSPEFNPDEKVWNHLKNQELKAHMERDIKGLKRLTNKKLKKMSLDEKLLKWIFLGSRVAKLMN